MRAFVHAGEEIGKGEEGLYARMPGHRLRGAHGVLAGEGGIRAGPGGGFAQVVGIRRRDEDVGEHRVGVERNRRQQRVELGLVVDPSLRLRRGLPDGQRREQYQCDPAFHGPDLTPRQSLRLSECVTRCSGTLTAR